MYLPTQNSTLGLTQKRGVFIAALVTKAILEAIQMSPIGTKSITYSHSMEYYSTRKRNEPWRHISMWVNQPQQSRAERQMDLVQAICSNGLEVCPRCTPLNQDPVQSFLQKQKSVRSYSMLHWRKRHFQKSAICSSLVWGCIGSSSNLMNSLALGFPGNEVQGKAKLFVSKLVFNLLRN